MVKYYVEANANGAFWYKDPEMKIPHREDGPAIDMVSGNKSWWVNGQRHREDGPAFITNIGYVSWYKNGKLHREDGPAEEDISGKRWWVNGQRHRIDGPAVTSNTCNIWWINGKLHREDGPAVEFANGDVQYWLNDKRMTKEEWEAVIQPVEELTVAQIEQLLGKRIKVIK